MRASQLAKEYFRDGKLFCAESVLLTVCQAQGVESPFIPGIATGFCSGLSRTRGMCGALAGATMAIGVFTGRPEPGEDFNRCYEFVQEFEAQFRARWGTADCYGIIGVDFADPVDQKRFREGGLICTCLDVVEWSVDTVQELLGQA